VIQRALVTGFEPFGGDKTNPSADLALALNGSKVGRLHIIGRVLPVEYAAAGELILEWLRELRPTVVICTGLAASADVIRIETVAVNEDDSPFPDNAGVVRERSPIVSGGPRNLNCTLPIEEILSECSRKKIAIEPSSDAGRYVCNHVFYTLLHERLAIPAGFIHLPPDLRTNKMSRAIRTILAATMRVHISAV
jgi:pyroglutamyl-peptidase